jgi:hypothetical protein
MFAQDGYQMELSVMIGTLSMNPSADIMPTVICTSGSMSEILSGDVTTTIPPIIGVATAQPLSSN